MDTSAGLCRHVWGEVEGGGRLGSSLLSSGSLWQAKAKKGEEGEGVEERKRAGVYLCVRQDNKSGPDRPGRNHRRA